MDDAPAALGRRVYAAASDTDRRLDVPFGRAISLASS
jgi:hypothetical protein